ncbi:hypothetical protein WA158_005766 [Blastocystis sp. Blastoise]
MKYFSQLIIISVFIFLASAVSTVKVEVYMESKCNACRRFIIYKLSEFLAHPDIKSMVDLEIVPFGNGKIISENPVDIICQHGISECRGNIVLLCGLKYNEDKGLDFLLCMEKYHSENMASDSINQCSELLHLDTADSVIECANGAEGRQLHLDAGKKTPSHRYVPWIVVDGKSLDGKINDFDKIICQAYQGEMGPTCQSILHNPRRLRDISIESTNNSTILMNNITNNVINNNNAVHNINNNMTTSVEAQKTLGEELKHVESEREHALKLPFTFIHKLVDTIKQMKNHMKKN